MEQWVMANKPKPSRRDAILDAVLDLVVERGFHDAPISLVSQRSGASPGIIYHYFSGKEEIIQALYKRIRAAKIEAIVGDFSPEKDPRDIFLQTCRNVYGFYRKHQREMSFYEQYEHAGFKCIPMAQADERLKAYARMFSSKSKGGVLREWPQEVFQELMLNVVSRLARQSRKLSDATLMEIAEDLWKMVRANKD
jgi:TetR/AcrR family transcriptional regulator, repressor of fatR-cypB operon